MHEFGTKILIFTDRNPIFKGGAVTIIGLLALLFVIWMQRRWKEPLRGGFLVFIAISIFIVLYGLFILIFQPQWWKLPY
jgi:hypothetical protein